MKVQFLYTSFIISILLSCSNETTHKMKNKEFKESENTAVFTTKFVIIDKKEITTVYHEKEDGAWQFFSDDNFEDYREVVKIVGLGQIIKIDETILEIADLPLGYKAFRKFKGDKWIVKEQK